MIWHARASQQRKERVAQSKVSRVRPVVWDNGSVVEAERFKDIAGRRFGLGVPKGFGSCQGFLV